MNIQNSLKKKYSIDSIKKNGNRCIVRMKENNIYALQDIEFLTGLETISETKSFIQNESLKTNTNNPTHINELNHIPQTLDYILSEAVKRRASDIHIEPYEDIIQIRFRVDGRLYKTMELPSKLKSMIITRLKVLSSLDIAERRHPQDGRTSIKIGDKTIDLRISILPTVFGEKGVIRILDKSEILLDIDRLGFENKDLGKIMRNIKARQGIILITGPTGCGKTTTLYSILNLLNKKEVNILTIEDPIEYDLPGINQMQVNEKIGFTFASALKSFLRQSPDIIMIGEIRDTETASVALRAAVTGHLVLSTVHTKDVVSTITRLIDLGVDNSLIVQAVNLIISQRLVRKLCNICQGKGCDLCAKTGYYGRTAIGEVMELTDKMRELVRHETPTHILKEKAENDGMLSLRDSAMMKVETGITSFEEIEKIVDDED